MFTKLQKERSPSPKPKYQQPAVDYERLEKEHDREIKEVQLMMSSIKSLGLFEELKETSKFEQPSGSKKEVSPSPNRYSSKMQTTGKKDMLRESIISRDSKVNYQLSDSEEEGPAISTVKGSPPHNFTRNLETPMTNKLESNAWDQTPSRLEVKQESVHTVEQIKQQYMSQKVVDWQNPQPDQISFASSEEGEDSIPGVVNVNNVKNLLDTQRTDSLEPHDDDPSEVSSVYLPRECKQLMEKKKVESSTPITIIS